jgi:hypothetical protein
MIATSCTGCRDCTCGCCSGISVQTPQGESNPPGLSAIAYRTGTWSSFKQSMLARLSSSDYPALAALTTRNDDDFSIALLDASAMVLDILTFYQERLANESYLRTATERFSLVQLSRLIGYQPSPGVSSSVYVAFTLTAAPGLPTSTTNAAIVIPAGTTLQSVPPQGQTPQAFQTSADILGKPEWNQLAIMSTTPWAPASDPGSVWFEGTSTQLNPGDPLLFLSDGSDWNVATVTAVTANTVAGQTLISWTGSLASQGSAFSSSGAPQVFALRQKAALFGYAAVDPGLLSPDTITQLGTQLIGGDWDFGTPSESLVSESYLDLDAVYSKLLPQSWLLAIPAPPYAGYSTLYQAGAINTVTRSNYGASAKISRVTLAGSVDQTWLQIYYDATRIMTVLAQSEPLTVAEQALDHPLYGTLIDLAGVRDDLVGMTAVAIIGVSQKVAVNVSGVQFQPYDSTPLETVNPGDVFTLMQPPTSFGPKGVVEDWSTQTTAVTLVVADAQGRPGTILVALSNLSLAPSASSDPVVQEIGLVASVGLAGPASGPKWTQIVLQAPLINCYNRAATNVNANVGLATAGGAVVEILGNGQASTPNQSFKLRQSPLTYVQAQTPTGGQSSLTVSVNGAAWTPVPTLYDQAANAKVYATVNQSDGTATVQFGDGVEGALLPTGQNNVTANYRTGIGLAGNVGAGSITTLVDRPLGAKSVTNPMAATGGQDPQTVGGIRANAPQTVVTLGRAVSITDYQTFAATFAGIAKAYAIWIPNGVNRGVFITVAAAGGAGLPATSPTIANLQGALTAYGIPNVNVQIQSFCETLFGLSAQVAYDPAYNATAVKAQIQALLQSTYSFAARGFGQGVSGDEIAALIQGVPGVLGVNVTSLTPVCTSTAGDLGGAGYSVAALNTWLQSQIIGGLPRPASNSPTWICPYIPQPQIGALPFPAEILVIHPDPAQTVLTVMTS